MSTYRYDDYPRQTNYVSADGKYDPLKVTYRYPAGQPSSGLVQPNRRITLEDRLRDRNSQPLWNSASAAPPTSGTVERIPYNPGPPVTVRIPYKPDSTYSQPIAPPTVPKDNTQNVKMAEDNSLLVQNVLDSPNTKVDVTSYPMDGRVWVVDCQASRIHLMGPCQSLNVVRSRNVVILCDKMDKSINISQSNDITMAVANQVPPIKLKQSKDVSIIAGQSLLKEAIETHTCDGVSVQSVVGVSAATPADDLLAARNKAEKVDIPEGIGLLQQSPVGWHRYQHMLRQTGIGLLLQTEFESDVWGPTGKKKYIINALVEGSAAEQSGAIRKGDELLSVDDVPVENRTLKDLSDLTTGPIGSQCKLMIKRDQVPTPFPVTLVRSIATKPDEATAAATSALPDNRPHTLKVSVEQAANLPIAADGQCDLNVVLGVEDPGASSMAGTTRSVLRSTEPMWKESFNFELGQGVKPGQVLKAQVVKSGFDGNVKEFFSIAPVPMESIHNRGALDKWHDLYEGTSGSGRPVGQILLGTELTPSWDKMGNQAPAYSNSTLYQSAPVQAREPLPYAMAPTQPQLPPSRIVEPVKPPPVVTEVVRYQPPTVTPTPAPAPVPQPVVQQPIVQPPVIQQPIQQPIVQPPVIQQPIMQPIQQPIMPAPAPTPAPQTSPGPMTGSEAQAYLDMVKKTAQKDAEAIKKKTDEEQQKQLLEKQTLEQQQTKAAQEAQAAALKQQQEAQKAALLEKQKAEQVNLMDSQRRAPATYSGDPRTPITEQPTVAASPPMQQPTPQQPMASPPQQPPPQPTWQPQRPVMLVRAPGPAGQPSGIGIHFEKGRFSPQDPYRIFNFSPGKSAANVAMQGLLRENEWIHAVNGTPIHNLSSPQVRDLIVGEPNTPVTLMVSPPSA